MNLWKLIDKWGPGAIALITLLGVVAYGWINGERVSRLEGAVESRAQMEIALRMEIQTLQAHVVKLREEIQKAGIKLPLAPTVPTTVTPTTSTPDKLSGERE